MNFQLNNLMPGVDIYIQVILFSAGALFVILVSLWFYRVGSLVDGFLKMATEVVGGVKLAKMHTPFFYKQEELKGSYKGRDVYIGVVYAGLQGEFMPLPYIAMGLRETVGYNINRLPNYATINKNFLLYKVKLSAPWGVFDRSYPQVFSKNYLIIAMEKLLATAEDVERDRHIKEVFK